MQTQTTKPLSGPLSSSLTERENAHLAPGLQRFAQMAGIAVKSASGSRITDVDERVYIDIIGGIGVNGLGHSHPKWVRAVQEQVEHCSVGSFTSEARVELLERLAKHQRSNELHYTQLYSSGAEAVESALRLAKCATGRNEFVSFAGGFHGKTMGVLSLMGSNFKDGLGPMVPGCTIVPYADCYRCPFKLKPANCSLACVESARHQIKLNTTGKVAAIILEPMQGTAGNIIPPKNFLQAIHSIAKEIGALLIADEMITGFGRTGQYWGTMHSGVIPDIITIGKQFGGGMPISGVISTSEIVKAQPWSNPSGSSSSYGGNPLVCAAAAAALRIIDEEGLVENSLKMGKYFLNKLERMPERYPFIGEVRGEGLFIGIDFVRDRNTREPLPKDTTYFIFNECVRHGLLTMSYDSRFRIQPAMTIDTKTIDEALEILYKVFDKVSI